MAYLRWSKGGALYSMRMQISLTVNAWAMSFRVFLAAGLRVRRLVYEFLVAINTKTFAISFASIFFRVKCRTYRVNQCWCKQILFLHGHHDDLKIANDAIKIFKIRRKKSMHNFFSVTIFMLLSLELGITFRNNALRIFRFCGNLRMVFLKTSRDESSSIISGHNKSPVLGIYHSWIVEGEQDTKSSFLQRYYKLFVNLRRSNINTTLLGKYEQTVLWLY